MKTIFNLIPLVLIALVLNASIKVKQAEIAEKYECREWVDENPYAKLDPHAVILLSKIIRAESVGESKQDKEWVGSVVLNRMKHKKYPSTMWSVVYQKRQFSGVNSKMFNYILREDSTLRKLDYECRAVAMDLLLNGSKLPKDILFYHNQKQASKNGKNWIARLVSNDNVFYYGTTGRHQYYGLN